MLILLLVIGLIVLSIGAEILVGSASRIAVMMGISPLVVGLTIVAFGTSAPELVVSLHSSLTGQSDVALGNVLGSNNFNILFVLGISALIVPLSVSIQLIRIEVPLMIAISILAGLLALDGRIGRWEGAHFLIYYVLYTVYLLLIASNSDLTSEFGLVMLLGVIPLTAITLLIGVLRCLPAPTLQQPDR